MLIIVAGHYHLVDEGDIAVIRPGIYCRERQLRDFSYSSRFPVINENCPACFESPKERLHVKKLLAREEEIFPALFSSLRNALMPLFDHATTDILGSIKQAAGRHSKENRNAVKEWFTRLTSGGSTFQNQDSISSQERDRGNHVNICKRTVDVFVGEASDEELIEELMRRRRKVQPDRKIRTKCSEEEKDREKCPTLHLNSESGISSQDAHLPSDAEFEYDLTKLQMFCTASSCV